jgi:hypothetical protein
MPNGVPEALTFVADADATVPASTSVVVVPSNQGDAPGLIVGYIDGSGDFQVLGDVNGIPVQGHRDHRRLQGGHTHGVIGRGHRDVHDHPRCQR